ncbi:MAG: VOC family protein [Bacteroidota bacterium]
MRDNTFIWTDLSCYNPKSSIEFYQYIFGWHIHDSVGYHVAYKGMEEIVGIYETPEFFKKIKMPHFWMNYIKVADVASTVEKANQLGAKVEIADAEFYGGRIALIRDPMGAGFTIYDGNKLRQTETAINGLVVGRELQVSNAQIAMDFYAGLLGWHFVQGESSNQFNAFSDDEKYITSIQEIDNATKGKYEYWVTIFGVNDMKTTQDKILSADGSLISDEGNRMLFTDCFGEAFFYVEGI